MPYRIVIAEDEPPLAAHLCTLARELSHEVLAVVESGTAAVEAAHHHGPDLVLMDIRLPGMDGISAARDIARTCEIPTIIITAFSGREYIEDAADAGVMTYLIKPVTLGELQAAIDLTMARFRELQDLRREVGDLRNALAQRKVVERAKGILMELHGWSEAEAFRRLQVQSQRENRRMIDVAQAVITAHALSDDNAGT